MRKDSQNPSRSDLQRRRDQSLWDRELHRRREQSARDREKHQERLLARAFHQLFPRLARDIALHTTNIIINVVHPSAPYSSPPVPPNAETMPAPSLPWKQDPNSGKAFDGLFNNEKYSDMTVYLGASKTPFPAHRVVLGIRSPYFDDALHSNFKEGITHGFRFEKESPHALWRVLQYMYTGDYADESSESLNSEGDDLELFKHPRVYALVDMFRIEGLKGLSCGKFELQLQQHWISDTLVDCIREVYSTSIDGATIRKAVVKTVSSHKRDLVQKRLFQDLLRE